MTFRNLKREARFIALIVLAILGTIVNSAIYFVSFLEHGFFMAALIWLAWGFVKDASSPDKKEN